MSPGANFFVIACGILIFSIINFSLAPIINRREGSDWDLGNCEKLIDDFDTMKKDQNLTDIEIENEEWEISRCKNRKGMYIMEYTSCFLNTAIGFSCFLLGWYGLQKELIQKTGMIGMACGVVGFVVTFIYVVYNGIVYNNYFPSSYMYKTDGEGAFAELRGDGYKCFYFSKKGNTRSFITKYSDLIKSQYNYNPELTDSFSSDEEKRSSYCTESNYPSICYDNGYINGKRTISSYSSRTCSMLYFGQTKYDFNNYSLSSRFLTLLILSLIISLLHCGLAYSGFKLFKETS